MSPILQPGTLDFISQNEDQTRRLGNKLGKLVSAGHVVALIGELGAGKTRWAQGMGQGLNLPDDDIVNSPTYTFINQYQGRLPFYHIDVYRLGTLEEADTLGLDDYIYGDGVCLIEWANRIAETLPPDRLEVELHHLGSTRRRVIMRAIGTTHQTLLDEFKALAFGIQP